MILYLEIPRYMVTLNPSVWYITYVTSLSHPLFEYNFVLVRLYVVTNEYFPAAISFLRTE